jgi:CDP-glycerol glycerophosphotransferase
MPKVSVIVSVYNSEAFLPTCLESILNQSFSDLELIVVDDASTDGSDRILESYAARDPRLLRIQLNENAGAGGARNAGLQRATGEYIWCIDSDDWIRPGALAAAMHELETRDLEVLLFGWTRVYPDGSRSICPEFDVLKAAPSNFTLHTWPQAIQVHHMPWNKIVKRDIVERTGFHFSRGWHQDLPFTYTMLSAARSIGALPSDLVMYRQHAGAATATKSTDHLCVLDQWALMFELVERHSPQPDLLRPHLVNRMLWHLSEQLKKQDRLPMKDWPEFARRAQALWRLRAPNGYSFPRGFTGIKYRMIAHHPGLVALVPRVFALRRSLRLAAGSARGWDVTAGRAIAGARGHSQPNWGAKP